MKKDIKNVVFTFGLVVTLVIVSANWYHRGVTMTENALMARREYEQQEHIAELEMQRLLLSSDIETATQPRERIAALAAADTGQAVAPVIALAAADVVQPLQTSSVAPVEKTKPAAVVTESPVAVTAPVKQSDTSAAQIAAQAKAAKEAQAAQEAALAEQIAAAKAAAEKQAVTLAATQVKTTQTATAKKSRQSRAS